MFEDIYEDDKDVILIRVIDGISKYIQAHGYNDITMGVMNVIRARIKLFLIDEGYKDSTVNMDLDESRLLVTVEIKERPECGAYVFSLFKGK